MSRIIKEKTLEKYYHCIVPGSVTLHERLTGYLYKDKTSNKVTIYKTLDEIPAKQKEKAEFIDTEFHTLQSDKKHSLIEVQIYTGKTHQIRAHLASIGHPIIGDGKYGINSVNKDFGFKFQQLKAHELKFNFKIYFMKKLFLIIFLRRFFLLCCLGDGYTNHFQDLLHEHLEGCRIQPVHFHQSQHGSICAYHPQS